MANDPLRFEHQSYAQRVVFGPGTAHTALGAEVERLGATRVLLVAAPSEAELAAELTTELPVAATFDEIRPHVPLEVAERARALAIEADADAVLSVGGGSTTGTAKAIAMTTGLPIIAVPTTYAGSEATPVWGLTEDGRKTTGVDPVVLPRTVVYDAELSRTLPVGLSVASGLNALAHCVDSLWAPRANPLLSALGTEGIRALAPALRAVVADPDDLEARSGCLYGAYLAAVTFAGAGSGLHHKICHALGGAYDLPHAETHAVVLPHALAYNAAAAPQAADRVATALGGTDAVAALIGLDKELDAPTSLRDFGLPEEGIAKVAAVVVEGAPAGNPAPVTTEGIEKLLRRAWAGEPPVTDHRPEEIR